MINIYEVFEKPMLKILAQMEIEGIKIDSNFLKVLSSKFEKKIGIERLNICHFVIFAGNLKLVI